MSNDAELDYPFASVLDLAPTIIKANPTWTDMWTAFASVLAANVEAPIEQLDHIRYILEDTDPRLAQETARLLGFDLSQDVLNLNSDNFTRIVTQLPMYPDQNGTELFVKFIDLALNAQTRVTNQYTKDYVNFYDEPQGELVMDGGKWFKTTHVTLELAIKNFNTLTLSPGQTLLGKTRELFFIFAPIHLVISKYVFIVELESFGFGLGAEIGITEMTAILN